jgi:hypothetical protein
MDLWIHFPVKFGVTWKEGETYRFTTNPDVFNLGDSIAYECNVLAGVDTLVDEMFTQPPHVISPEILVLENELDILRAPACFVDL